MSDDYVEPTLEKELAGRMDAADRATRLEDEILRRRQERRLVQAMATPPAAGDPPNLDQLRELLVAVKNDPAAGLPWWLGSTPGGDDDGYDGTTDVGGIVASWDRTTYDHTGTAVGAEPDVNDLGLINPPLAEALAVAAVNALPWLLAEVDRLRTAVALVRRLNKPMQEQLRRAAADTSPNWDVTATIYPPSAQGLVALIDALNANSNGRS